MSKNKTVRMYKEETISVVILWGESISPTFSKHQNLRYTFKGNKYTGTQTQYVYRRTGNVDLLGLGGCSVMQECSLPLVPVPSCKVSTVLHSDKFLS